MLNNYDLDYVHISSMGNAKFGYLEKPNGIDKTYSEIYREVLDPKIKIILCGCILTAADAKKAVEIGDLAAIAREALLEPKFAQKIEENHPETIVSEITPERLKNDVKWPQGLQDMIVYDLRKGNQKIHGYNTSVPLPNDESIIKYDKETQQ